MQGVYVRESQSPETTCKQKDVGYPIDVNSMMWEMMQETDT